MGFLKVFSMVIVNLAYFSEVIDILPIYCRFIAIFWGGQRGMCSQTSKMTYIFLCYGGSNPRQKVCNALSRPLGQVCPCDISSTK